MALEAIFKHVEQGLREQAALAREESAALIRSGEDEAADVKDSEALLYRGKARQIRTLLRDALSGFQKIDVEEPPVEVLRMLVLEREIPSAEPLLIHGATLTELTPDDKQNKHEIGVIKDPGVVGIPEPGLLSPPPLHGEEEKNPIITNNLAKFYEDHPELELFTREHVRMVTGHGVFGSAVVKEITALAIKLGVTPPEKSRAPWRYPKPAFEATCYFLGPVGPKGRRTGTRISPEGGEQIDNLEITRKLKEFYQQYPDLTVFTRAHIRQVTGRSAFVTETIQLMADIAEKHGIESPAKKTDPWQYNQAAFEEICYALGRPRTYPASRTSRTPGEPVHTNNQPDASASTATLEATTEIPKLDPAKILLMVNALFKPHARAILEEVTGDVIHEEDLAQLQQIADKFNNTVELPEDVDDLVIGIAQFLESLQANPVEVLKSITGTDAEFALSLFPIGPTNLSELFLKMHEAAKKDDGHPTDIRASVEEQDSKLLTEYDIGVLAYYLIKNVYIYQKIGNFTESGYLEDYLERVTAIKDLLIELPEGTNLKDTPKYIKAHDLLLEKLRAFVQNPAAFLDLHKDDSYVNTLLQPFVDPKISINDLEFMANRLLPGVFTAPSS